MLFVTSTTTVATSSDIAFYDAFVSTAASGISFANTDIASPTWEAIVSTGQGFTELSASLHTDSFPTAGANLDPSPSGGFFNTAGSLVATDNANLWNSNTATFPATVEFDETGTLVTTDRRVWTGTNNNGFGNANFLGQASGSNAGYGVVQLGTGGWINAGTEPNTTSYRLYGMSEMLTVVPEPSTYALLTGLFGLGLILFRRRSKKNL
jgi:hypothetical protein